MLPLCFGGVSLADARHIHQGTLDILWLEFRLQHITDTAEERHREAGRDLSDAQDCQSTVRHRGGLRAASALAQHQKLGCALYGLQEGSIVSCQGAVRLPPSRAEGVSASRYRRRVRCSLKPFSESGAAPAELLPCTCVHQALQSGAFQDLCRALLFESRVSALGLYANYCACLQPGYVWQFRRLRLRPHAVPSSISGPFGLSWFWEAWVVGLVLIRDHTRQPKTKGQTGVEGLVWNALIMIQLML